MHSAIRGSARLIIFVVLFNGALGATCNITCADNAGTTFTTCWITAVDEYWSCVNAEGGNPKQCSDQRAADITSCQTDYHTTVAFCGCSTNCPNPPNIDCGGTAKVVCPNATGWECSDGSKPCSMPPPGFNCICISGGTWINCRVSPIVIDTRGEGFRLTDADHGVWFQFVPLDPAVKISWTDSRFSNGWLVLDRNGNGKIDDATELFGNITPQPPSRDPNGYAALAVFDDPSNGGNGDGVIDSRDSIYQHLRVWIDSNHNGVSESEEIVPIAGYWNISHQPEIRSL